ncbi:hypothetical protein QQ045_018249 [Rhodiola kirilowii]
MIEESDILTAVPMTKNAAREFGCPEYRFVVSSPEAGLCWTPPEAGVLKITCDGAWCSITGKAGIGVVCRDHEEIVKFAIADSFHSQRDITEVEGSAIWRGMSLAAAKGFSRVIFASDNAEIIQTLLKPVNLQTGERRWMVECRRMLENFQDWRLEHMLREANLVADHLAQKAREEGWSWSSMDAIPMFLSPFISNDSSSRPCVMF